jgi:single-stranded-DNA-specific exonuclease
MNDAAPEQIADIAPREARIEIPPCDWAAVSTLREELGLSSIAAQILVRRGVDSPESARQWLAGGELNDPALLPGAVDAAAFVVAHIGRGSRIVVHGDYDVDGVSSTAILVRALAGVGADVTWHVPSRFEDGYGLSRATVERLAAGGADLIVAVDCGIGSVEEVAFAKSIGVEVVVVDHHTIGETLPDAPVVHPGLGGYSDPSLCAAATTHKLATLIVDALGGSRQSVDSDLALVALATVCDVVPLVGENRALVARGVQELRQTQLPGLRELMRVAGVNQLKLTAESLGFSLGPRINAAGRMYSAEPAVELMLTTNEARAAELADQLGSANHQRRDVEQGVLIEAEAQAREQVGNWSIVLAGEGWHPGVLGIVAGRVAETYRRPTVALSVEDGVAAGSGRSRGNYDLHSGLAACSDLLVRFGGHRAAAGLELAVDDLSAFRRRFEAHAAAALTLEDLRPHFSVDAVAAPEDITLERVAEFERLGPFGAANPMPKLLIPGADLVAVSKMGQSGAHFKLGLAVGGARGTVVAFRQERAIASNPLPRPVDCVVEFSRNEFNGREEARGVLQAIVEREAGEDSDWEQELVAALDRQPPTLHPPGGALLEREQLVTAYRVARDSGSDSRAFVESLRTAIPNPSTAALVLESLAEIEVVRIERSDQRIDAVVADDAVRRELDQSRTFRSYSGHQEESERWQRSSTVQTTQR